MTQEILKHLATQYLCRSEDLLCQDGFKVAVLTGLEREMSYAASPSSAKENENEHVHTDKPWLRAILNAIPL